jgi:hypothetical protein
MVLTAKIFEVKAETTIGAIAAKLSGLRLVETVSEDKSEFELVTDVHDLTAGKNYVTAIFSRDKLIKIKQRGRVLPIIKTIEAVIDFRNRGEKIFLTVAQEKYFANYVATTLSNSLFLNYRSITESSIPSENMQKIHESNPDGTKLIWFDQVDIPGVAKLALAGPSLRDTSLYEEYLKHGKIWYIVYTTREGGRIFGLTRNGVVTCFTPIEEKDFLDYIFTEVFPLLS